MNWEDRINSAVHAAIENSQAKANEFKQQVAAVDNLGQRVQKLLEPAIVAIKNVAGLECIDTYVKPDALSIEIGLHVYSPNGNPSTYNFVLTGEQSGIDVEFPRPRGETFTHRIPAGSDVPEDDLKSVIQECVSHIAVDSFRSAWYFKRERAQSFADRVVV